MPRPQARKAWDKAGFVALLAWVGGFVDGVGFLVLFGMFTSHMSGNTVVAGVSLGRERWPLAFHHLFPIPLFVAGLLLGTLLMEVLRRRGARSPYAVGLGLEALLLIVFLLCGAASLDDPAFREQSPLAFYSLAALLPSAMGLQNATFPRAGGMNVATTFIGGILNNMSQQAVRYLCWLYDRRTGRRPRSLALLLRLSPRQETFTRALVFLGVWLAYLVGAVLGAWTHQFWGVWCLLLPIGSLLIIVGFDLSRPFGRDTASRGR